MALIEFENKPSTDTPINANNLNHNFEEVNEKDYILTTIDNNMQVATNTKILLNTVVSSKGNSFSLDTTNNEIVIGSDVSKVEISANCFVEVRSNYVWLQVLNGNNMVASTLVNSDYFVSTPIPSIIVNVQENDRIKLICDSPAGGQIRSTSQYIYLQIKKVK